MKMFLYSLVLISATGYRFPKQRASSWARLHQVTTSSSAEDQSWQKQLDEFLDIDTPCDNRRDIAKELFGKFGKISKDVIEAIQDRDLSSIAPKVSRI